MADENNFYDNSSYENLPSDAEGELPEESSNNRTFMIAVGILGGLILISVACLGAVYLFGSRGANTAQVAAASANATQTEVANQIKIRQALTATANAALPTPTLSPTPTSTPPVSVASPTSTPGAVSTAAASGSGPSGTQVAATSTVAAALTKAAEAQSAITPLPTITPSMPNSGFADEYGLPGLVVMALAFIVVILFARTLRVSTKAR